MSLINQMLKDLAQRQASSNKVPEQITAIQTVSRPVTIPVWVWVSIAILINASTLAWFWWQARSHNAAPTIAQSIVAQSQSLSKPKSTAPTATAATSRKITAPVATPPPQQTQPAIHSTQASNSAAGINSNSPIPPGKPAETQINQPASSPVQPENAANLPPVSPIEQSNPASENVLTNPASAVTSKATINKQIQPLSQTQTAENDYLKALSLAQQGDSDQAIAGFIHVLLLDPHYHQARLMLVGLLIENKRPADAERSLQQGLTENPEQTDFAMLLARLQLEHEGLDTSLATLIHSLPYAGNQAEYQAFLAALLQRDGKPEQAVAHYVIALKQNPQSGIWWMGLGISELALKHPNEAREAFARAKATNSLNPDLQAYVDQQLQQP